LSLINKPDFDEIEDSDDFHTVIQNIVSEATKKACDSILNSGGCITHLKDGTIVCEYANKR